MSSNWSEPVEGQGVLHDFKVDPVLTAHYQGSDVIEVRDGYGTRETRVHHFRDVSHTLIDVWGSVDVDQKLRKIPPGTLVRVEFTGSEPDATGTKTTKRFRVQFDASAPKYLDPTAALAPAPRMQSAPIAGSGDADIPF